MKNINLYIIGFLFVALASCSVADYDESNPPRLLDAPAVNGASIDKTVLSGGETATIIVTVADAPAGIDSASVVDTDALGIAAGGSSTIISGMGITSGEVVIEYTAPLGFSGTIDLAVSVGDAQVNDKGDYAGKFSVAEDLEADVLCGDLSGVYAAAGTILVDDFGSGPFAYDENITLFACDTENEYVVSDISGGLYTNDYATEYDVDPAPAVLTIDPTSGDITWAGVPDQFTGEFVQDPAQPMSTYDATAGTMTIYWTATRWGERGVLVLTK